MLYVDTGPLVAWYLASDQYHDRAMAGWQRLSESSERLATSNLVLAEAITLLARRAGSRFAVQQARGIFKSPRWSILRADQQEEIAALALLERYADHEISYVDCISCALMHKHRIRRAYAFDRHFTTAGFEVWG